MTTWYKFPTSFFEEPRTFRLRKAIGDPAWWVPVRLWAFAASQDGSGDLSGYDAADIADAIHYTGNAIALMDALTPDFMDKKRRIVGWKELFALAESRRRAAIKGASARWNPDSPRTPLPIQEEKREEERRGEGDAMRDAMRDAYSPSQNGFAISDQTKAEIRSEFGLADDAIDRGVRLYRENKTPYIATDGPLTDDGFKGWMRTSKAGKKFVASAGKSAPGASRSEEPANWRERLTKENPGCPYSHGKDREGTPWSAIDPAAQARIREYIGEAAT